MPSILGALLLGSLSLRVGARTSPARLDLFVNTAPLSQSDAIDQFAGLLDPATILQVHDLFDTVNLVDDQAVPNSLADLTASFDAIAAGLDASQRPIFGDMRGCLHTLDTKQSRLADDNEACVRNGRSSSHYRSLYNAVVEQLVGIVAPRALNRLTDSTQPSFRSGLLSDGLFRDLKASMLSISATTHGDTALALEQAADCFDRAAQLADQEDAIGTRCFTASSGPLITLETAYASIVQQAAGALPPNVLLSLANSAPALPTSVYSLTSAVGAYWFSRAHMTPGEALRQHVFNALSSFVSSVSGEGSNAGVQLVVLCANNLLSFSTAPATLTCTVSSDGPSAGLRNIVYGAAQQFIGYLPPNVVLDLQQAASPYFTADSSPKAAAGAFRDALARSFDVASKGPALTTCFEAAVDCAASAFTSGHHIDCDAAGRCQPLVSA